MDYFASEYQQGRTPNPCVKCNERLKFGKLMDKALGLGSHFIAMGHYARVERVREGCILRRAKDLHKDQSYFLFSLSQEQLARVLLPIGGMTKEETRRMAREVGLQVHDKEESQDICFVPEHDYTAFLKIHLGQAKFQDGEIVHRDGRILGRHQGIEFYTVGQRKGIHVGYPKPLYVLEIDVSQRRVIVGEDDDLWCDEFWVERSCWGVHGIPKAGTQVMVKIRHRHEGARGTLYPEGQDQVHVQLNEPQRAITPGQAAVFYDGEDVLGGGWIMKNCRMRNSDIRRERAVECGISFKSS